MHIVVAILALSFLILVHEIGHFTAAKLLKVKVLEFAIFMGPKLFGIKKGDTEYTIRLIPIGGFVKMEGENEESDDERAFNKKPKWVRAVIMSAGSFINILVAFILLLILIPNVGFGSTQLGNVVPGSPAAVAGLLDNDVIVKYGGKSVNAASDVLVYMMDSKGAEVAVTFEREGNVMEVAMRPEYFPRNYYIMGFTPSEYYGADWNVVSVITENGPASDAGMIAGDRIIAINGVVVDNREELRYALAEDDGAKKTVTIKRDDVFLDVPLTPEVTESEEYYELGAYFGLIHNATVFETIKYAYYDAISYSRMVLYSLKWLVTGRVGLGQISGPVGIVVTIGDVVSEAGSNIRGMIFQLMSMVALIGINLGLFNLIPFPALDGSKLLLILIEAIRGKRISVEREATISFFGFLALILLMVVTFFNDIVKLVSG